MKKKTKIKVNDFVCFLDYRDRVKAGFVVEAEAGCDLVIYEVKGRRIIDPAFVRKIHPTP